MGPFFFGEGLLGAAAGKFAPAEELIEGSIQYRKFLRGDGNADGAVDLSDAVATLSHLFVGAAPPECLDGADADDSKGLDITDPILLLGALFPGQEPLPAPYPSCGYSPEGGRLGCERSACAGK